MTAPSIIDHQRAAEIADEWRGLGMEESDGVRRPWIPLADTGEIIADAHEWIEALMMDAHPSALRDLRSLLAYVEHYGERGPQPGWPTGGGRQ